MLFLPIDSLLQRLLAVGIHQFQHESATIASAHFGLSAWRFLPEESVVRRVRS